MCETGNVAAQLTSEQHFCKWIKFMLNAKKM